MAKKNKTITFKGAQISLEEDTITEYTKDGILIYSLSETINEFAGDNRFIDITFRENIDIEPESIDG